MKKLNDHGKKQIQDFLLKNHKNGHDILNRPMVLENWYAMADSEYKSSSRYPTIGVDSHNAIHGFAVHLLIQDTWFDDASSSANAPSDVIDPSLIGKKIRDWC
jgi:hypothetical protein